MPLLVTSQGGTPEWHEARLRRITSSNAAACLGLNPNVSRQKAWRVIMGREIVKDNDFMKWGRDREAHAREEYEIETGRLVAETGFWVSGVYDWLGASPDGFVGGDGLLEVKCPGELPDSVPVQYRIQMLVQMIVTGRKWCDFWAWTPNGKTFLRRVHLAGEAGIIRKLEAFYQNHILTDTEPPRKKPKRRNKGATT